MQKNNKLIAIDGTASTDENWRPLRAPFGYYGSKRRLASQLVAQLPIHSAWVEAFCGSAALTLAKAPAQIEVINDINGEVVNFFRQLRDNASELCYLLELTPYAREELKLARIPQNDLSDVERARRFFVATMMAINGSSGDSPGGFSFSNTYSRRNMEARVSRWKAMPEHLERVAERLSRIRIENVDAIELFSDFSQRPATLVYFDPPYLGDRIRGYDHDQYSESYHEKLLLAVIQAKCMVFLSGYENALYNKYLTPENGWQKKQIKATTRGNNGKDSERQEILWYNEHYVKAVKANRSRVRLSAKERQQMKVNPKRE